MSKRLHYSVRSVVALCCISFLLFSVHLDVKAATSFYYLFDNTSIIDESTIPVSFNFTIEPTNSFSDMGGGTISYSENGTSISRGGGGIVGLTGTRGSSYLSSSTVGTASISLSGSVSSTDYNNATTGTATISATTTHGGSSVFHYHIPMKFNIPFATAGIINPNDYYGYFPALTQQSVSISGVNNVTLSNVSLTDKDGTIIYIPNGSDTNRNCIFLLGTELLSNVSNVVCITSYIDFDVCIPDLNNQVSGTFSGSFYPRLRRVSTNKQGYVGNIQSDPIQHQLQEENNATASDTNTTTHSIFDSISAFFSSFFSNLIGVFVPEDGFFTTWFNNLNTLLEAKLGILYYPFSVIIQFFTRCTSAFSSQSTGTDIVFPAIEFTNSATGETYTFLSAQHINLADFNITTSSSANSSLVGSSGFGSLVDIIRTFNAFVILFCLLSLLRTKLNLVLRGDNNDN